MKNIDIGELLNYPLISERPLKRMSPACDAAIGNGCPGRLKGPRQERAGCILQRRTP